MTRRLVKNAACDEFEILEEEVIVQVADRIVYGQAPYINEFTQADLTTDILMVPHNLLASNGAIKIILFNDKKLEVQPSDVEIVDENNAKVSLKGYTPITGRWRIKAL